MREMNSLSGELESLLRDYNAGMQFEPQNAPSLAGALQQLEADRPRRRAMGANALRAAEQFDSGLQYQRLADLVASLDGSVPAEKSR